MDIEKVRGIAICTDNFTFEEVNLLANAISENFKIVAKVVDRRSSNGNLC
jgi:hypothetical protein